MTESDSEPMSDCASKPGLTRLEFVAGVLQPLKLIVWGDLAMAKLGVKAVHDCYMLGVRDGEIEQAAEKLAEKGFIRQNWSFGSTIDPATHKDDAIWQQEHARIGLAYANFDAKTIRFLYPDESKYVQQTVLIRTSYLHLSVPQFSPSSKYQYTTEHGNLYYPNPALLLQSIIKALLEERQHTSNSIGDWGARLEGWAIAYLYGQLSLRDDVLDTCKDEAVLDYFNQKIERGSGARRVREKWGTPQAQITNDLIKDFQ